MKTGFVFGKYYPFHKGHQALIDFALTKCTKLYVIVCASEKESIPVGIRANWIRKTFSHNSSVEIIEFSYQEADLPNTSTSSRVVSKVWAEKFKEILPKVDIVVTSEPYGDYVADYMSIEHFIFDNERNVVPISATQIREDFYNNWEYLPDAVKSFYQQKIVFLGTESTGKSSLSKAISERYNSTLVEEVGREIVEDSNDFNINQLYLIAKLHAQNIEKACQELKPFVFIDTDIHITQSYAKFCFGEYLNIAPQIYQTNKADEYFYLTKEFLFTQDGTRLEEENRNLLDVSHRETLKDSKIDFLEISGAWEARFDSILKSIDKKYCL